MTPQWLGPLVFWALGIFSLASAYGFGLYTAMSRVHFAFGGVGFVAYEISLLFFLMAGCAAIARFFAAMMFSFDFLPAGMTGLHDLVRTGTFVGVGVLGFFVAITKWIDYSVLVDQLTGEFIFLYAIVLLSFLLACIVKRSIRSVIFSQGTVVLLVGLAALFCFVLSKSRMAYLEARAIVLICSVETGAVLGSLVYSDGSYALLKLGSTSVVMPLSQIEYIATTSAPIASTDGTQMCPTFAEMKSES